MIYNRYYITNKVIKLFVQSVKNPLTYSYGYSKFELIIKRIQEHL